MNKESSNSEYSVEFKESAVKMAIESDQPMARTAKDLGVNKNTLYNWVGKYHQKSSAKAGKVDDEHLYDELKRLRRENKRLQEEREILKKAAAYFAKESL